LRISYLPRKVNILIRIPLKADVPGERNVMGYIILTVLMIILIIVSKC